MKLRLEDKNKAIELRQKGYSYNEIRGLIPNVSKGTLSGWLKHILLTSVQKRRILAKIRIGSEQARAKGAWTNKRKAIDRINNIQKEARKEFPVLLKNNLFLTGLSLYWAEGAKTNGRFQFINSDPEMMKIILKWVRKIFRISDNDILVRLYIHEIYKKENCEQFWSKITKIKEDKFQRTIYKPTKHLIKKNINYKGCCRIELRGSELFWKITKWREMLIQYYK